MHEQRFVTYYRVSTQAQGRSGLGLEAQRVAVEHYLRSREGKLIGEFTEIETGKGANALERRPELRAALDLARRQGAVLVLAKLDRLARNVHFVTGPIESGVDFVAADMPHATKVMIQIHAVMAEHERDQISARTKAALAAAKARGVKLGVTGLANLRPNLEARQEAAKRFAERMKPIFEGFELRGLSQRQMVAELNALGIKTPRGGAWRLKQVQRVLKRASSMSSPASELGQGAPR
jgi:DNA invertase Pin-like site-specific DNA recombinase